MLERLKALFRGERREPDDEPRDPRDEAELPAGPLTGLTSPLDVGGQPPRGDEGSRA